MCFHMVNTIRRNALILTPFFFIVIPFSILFPSVGAEPLYLSCSDVTANYTLNGPFENNLKLLFQILPSSTSTTGFHSTSTGETPNKIYGQALCRGDVNSTICQSCVENASREVLGQCKSTDAIIWYQVCQVRYSFQMFFNFSVYTGKYPSWDSQEKLVAKPAPFFKAVRYLMTNLTYQVSVNSSKPMFATGEVRFSRSETIYGLIQCTRDISVDDCQICLASASGDLKGCCDTRQGGIVLSRNCNVRFEVYSFYNASTNLVSYPISSSESRWKIWMIVSPACVAIISIVIGFWLFCCLRKRKKQKALFAGAVRSEQALLQELATPRGVEMNEKGELASAKELFFVDLQTVIAASDNFSDSNKLGQGGFGSVYKGILPDGNVVAIKRLSRKSWQGLEEFKNEILLIAKLQHRNLVRLLGCGLEGQEKLLIYEFMPNNSLDTLIFDPERRSELEWDSYHNIICGIARGLLYLHEDSPIKIIHRDLKPSNVLLDGELIPKISDFGMARIFGEHQDTANTRRVVGTYGYMAPEYAMEGIFSVKSDVFSFGVILLEIISGKRNSGFYLTEVAPTLLAYAWRLWQDGKEMGFVDDSLFRRETRQTAEMVRCMHIGLLCVQEDPDDRPTMSFVFSVLLSSDPSTILPQPKKPAFSVGRKPPLPTHNSCSTDPTENQITVSSMSPR